MSYNFFIETLGCPKNIADSLCIKGALNLEGNFFTDDLSSADIVIVNTCGFIEAAKKESIDLIIKFIDWKNKAPNRLLVIAGCLAQKYSTELYQDIPEADLIIGTGDLPVLARAIDKLRQGVDRLCLVGQPEDFLYNNEWVKASGYGEHRAYLKIAEGCNNKCTYCVIPEMRGSYRSRGIEEILAEAAWLSANGTKEIILVAQDTTLYGMDIYNELVLPDLLRNLCLIDDIEWIRLLYTYPANITDDLLDVIATEEKVCPYLDIPLQHISDPILKKMGRNMSSKEIKTLISKIKSLIPYITLRTTFIVGFPGESQADFDFLLDFVQEAKFDRAGFFAYSKEPGTKAAKMKNQIPIKTKIKRLQAAEKLQYSILTEKQNEMIGQIVQVIVDGPSPDNGLLWEGRTKKDAPDIDCVVYFNPTEKISVGQFLKVKITHTQDFALIGEIINEFGK